MFNFTQCIILFYIPGNLVPLQQYESYLRDILNPVRPPAPEEWPAWRYRYMIRSHNPVNQEAGFYENVAIDENVILAAGTFSGAL